MRGMRNYSPEFRADAVALFRRSNRSLRDIATDLGINHWTLRGWYRDDEMRRATKRQRREPTIPREHESPDETIQRLEREVAQLKKQNEQLEMDRAI
ncbi:MAG: transposase [Deltaproteobacteria bacterium]|nr:transposase [Deltaproteobacteria bacterium]